MLESRALIEVANGHILFEALDDLRRLLGKAIALVGCAVVRLGVAIGQNVHDYDCGDDDQDVDGSIRRVLSLPGF